MDLLTEWRGECLNELSRMLIFFFLGAGQQTLPRYLDDTVEPGDVGDVKELLEHVQEELKQVDPYNAGFLEGVLAMKGS